jgi:hypothetical protein
VIRGASLLRGFAKETKELSAKNICFDIQALELTTGPHFAQAPETTVTPPNITSSKPRSYPQADRAPSVYCIHFDALDHSIALHARHSPSGIGEFLLQAIAESAT